MGQEERDWIVQKASEMLSDKVEDGPLKEEDIGAAFDIFANPRLEKISESFSDKNEYTEAVNHVRVKLHEIAKQLNSEHWPADGI